MPVNIEIKARCPDPVAAAEILALLGAEAAGKDRQTDTYFNINDGRLKLREGNIENNLIYYERKNEPGPGRSAVMLYPTGKDPQLRNILEKALGIMKVVKKSRCIYYLGNVKFHIDQVEGLGHFIEIEAIGENGDEEKLDRQCRHYMNKLGIDPLDLVAGSYSDMVNP
jgi:adenylate cyclase, class 2